MSENKYYHRIRIKLLFISDTNSENQSHNHNSPILFEQISINKTQQVLFSNMN